MPVDLLAVSRHALQSKSASDQISATYPTLSFLICCLFLVPRHSIASMFSLPFSLRCISPQLHFSRSAWSPRWSRDWFFFSWIIKSYNDVAFLSHEIYEQLVEPVQSSSPLKDCLVQVKNLKVHQAYNLTWWVLQLDLGLLLLLAWSLQTFQIVLTAQYVCNNVLLWSTRLTYFLAGKQYSLQHKSRSL